MQNNNKKATREKSQITNKSKHIRVTREFSVETTRQRGLEQCAPSAKEPRVPTQTTLPSKII